MSVVKDDIPWPVVVSPFPLSGSTAENTKRKSYNSKTIKIEIYLHLHTKIYVQIPISGVLSKTERKLYLNPEQTQFIQFTHLTTCARNHSLTQSQTPGKLTQQYAIFHF